MARVTAVFELIDRMSGKLAKIEHQAKETEDAIDRNAGAVKRLTARQERIQAVMSRWEKDRKRQKRQLDEETESVKKLTVAFHNLVRVQQRLTYRQSGNVAYDPTLGKNAPPFARMVHAPLERSGRLGGRHAANHIANRLVRLAGKIPGSWASDEVRAATAPGPGNAAARAARAASRDTDIFIPPGRYGRGYGGGGGRGPDIGGGISSAAGDLWKAFRGRRGLLGGFSGFALMGMTGILSELASAITSLGAAVVSVIPMISALGAGIAGLASPALAFGASVGIGAAIGIPALVSIQRKYQDVQSAVEAVNSATTPKERKAAIDALTEANGKLSASEYRVISGVKQLGNVWKQETQGMTDSVISFVGRALDVGAKLIPVYAPFMRAMNTANINIGDRFLGAMMDPNEQALNMRMLNPLPDMAEKGAAAVGQLARALRGLVIAAAPLGGWLLDNILEWATELGNTGSSASGIARWQRGLDSMRPTLAAIWDVLDSIGDAWMKLTEAAAPLANSLLRTIADQFDRITSGNIDSMTKGFSDQIPHLEAIGRLLDGIISAVWQLAQLGAQYLDPIVDAITDHLLPALVDIIDAFTKQIGPILPEIVAEFSEIAKYVGEGIAPALGIAAKALEGMMSAFNSMPDWMKNILIIGVGGGVIANKAGFNILEKIPVIGKFFEGRPKGSINDPIWTASAQGGIPGVGGVPGAAKGGRLARGAAAVGRSLMTPGGLLRGMALAGIGIAAWDQMRGQAGPVTPHDVRSRAYRDVSDKLRGTVDSGQHTGVEVKAAQAAATIQAFRAAGWDTRDQSTLPGQLYAEEMAKLERLQRIQQLQAPFREEVLNRISEYEKKVNSLQPKYDSKVWEQATRPFIMQTLRRASTALFTDDENWSVRDARKGLTDIAQMINHRLTAASMTHDFGKGRLPRFRRGGITRGPSLAGESGPEAVIPLVPTSGGLQALLQALLAYSGSGMRIPGGGARLTPTTHTGSSTGTRVGAGQQTNKETNYHIDKVIIQSNDPDDMWRKLARQIQLTAATMPTEDMSEVYD